MLLLQHKINLMFLLYYGGCSKNISFLGLLRSTSKRAEWYDVISCHRADAFCWCRISHKEHEQVCYSRLQRTLPSVSEFSHRASQTWTSIPAQLSSLCKHVKWWLLEDQSCQHVSAWSLFVPPLICPLVVSFYTQCFHCLLFFTVSTDVFTVVSSVDCCLSVFMQHAVFHLGTINLSRD